MKKQIGGGWLVVGAVFLIIGIILIVASCDTGARKDLPQDDQILDESEATVIVMPDQYPNVTHKCLDTTGVWATTDNWTWIVYRDPACGGEGEPIVLDNVPGSG